MGKRSASSYRGGGKGRVGGNCSLPAAENSKLPSSRYAFGVTTSRFAQLATRLLSGREPGSRFCLVLASFIVSLERLHRGPSGFELSLSQDLTIQKPKTLDPGGADILLDFFMRLNLNFADIPTGSLHPTISLSFFHCTNAYSHPIPL